MEYIRGILPFTSPAHQTAFCSRSQLALLEALIAFRYTRNLGLPFSTDKSLINDFSKTLPASEKVCIHCLHVECLPFVWALKSQKLHTFGSDSNGNTTKTVFPLFNLTFFI